MASIEENILTAIKAKGRGSIFFPSDFTSYGEVKAIGKSLERLTAKGDIIRLARGIYLYPEIDIRGEKRCVSKFGRSENI